MAIAVVGSVAFDSVSSPFGSAERELGGSAVHAALAAARFTDAWVVGPVGEDFSREDMRRLEEGGARTAGLQRLPGDTLYWRGRYEFDMAAPRTEEIRFGVFGEWRPQLTGTVREAELLFLGAMHPALQAEAHSQWEGSGLSALDSMDYWIDTERDALIEAIRLVDIVFLTDREARSLVRDPMLLRAAREIMSWGPRAVVIRLGEHGCALLTEHGYFSQAGYLMEDAADPTGCGDAFAGGFLGCLDRVPIRELTEGVLRRAAAYGTVLSSYCLEGFGPRRTLDLSEREVDHRFHALQEMTHFERVPTGERPREGHEEGEGPPERLERPDPTPTTGGLDAPGRTAGTQTPRSPDRTPSTETMPPPRRPVRPPQQRE